MLISHEQPLDETVTVSTGSTAALEPILIGATSTSSDELLAELTELVAAQKQSRQVTVSIYLGGAVIFMAGVVVALLQFMANPISSHMAWFIAGLVGKVALMLAAVNGGIWIGRRYYRRHRDRLTSVVSDLAARGDMRMLPCLLSVMDIRNSGVLMWKECRPVFMQALESLLSTIKPEEFQGLSERQMWEVASLLLYPDGNLSRVVEAAMIRCGDDRMLHSLQKLRALCAVSQVNPNSLLTRFSPGMGWLRKQGVPFATLQTIEAIDRTIAEVTVRTDEARRNAQLLRASTPSAGQVSRELLRAASTTNPTASEELVRASEKD